MSSYFISPQADTGFRLSSEELERMLTARWPDVRLTRVTDPERRFVLEFEYGRGADLLSGMLNRKGTSIVLDGSLERCAEFAAWFGGTVNPLFGLTFYDEGYTTVVPLTDNPPAPRIVEAFVGG